MPRIPCIFVQSHIDPTKCIWLDLCVIESWKNLNSCVYIHPKRLFNIIPHYTILFTFYTVHYGKLLKERPTNALVVYLFSLIYSHLHVSVISFNHHQGA